jgi:hypothetical protein
LRLALLLRWRFLAVGWALFAALVLLFQVWLLTHVEFVGLCCLLLWRASARALDRVRLLWWLAFSYPPATGACLELLNALTHVATTRSELFLQLIKCSAPDLPPGQLYPLASEVLQLKVDAAQRAWSIF